MTFIPGWNTFYRWWSTWLITAGSSIIFFAPEVSEALLYAWSIIPMDIKTTFDPTIVRSVGYGIALLSIPAKLIKQKSINRDAAP